MKRSADLVRKLNSLMQMSPPNGSSLNKNGLREVYPYLYFDAVPDETEQEKRVIISDDGKGYGKESQTKIPSDMTLLIQRTLRSGQSIHYAGHVVVMGDVNPGAEIVAGGNILVLGSLRGVAHAGAFGNSNALVAAFRLNPIQLRISGHITRAPDDEEFKPRQPEIARIYDGTVVIERYYPGWDKGI